MMCKDCKLKKCVHSFNANNVDNCKRIKEVRYTIRKNKKSEWEKELYAFINKMQDKYDRTVSAEFQYDGVYGYPYLTKVNLKIW